MPVTVGANKLSVVHAASNGLTVAFPDVCKTPAPPAPPIPIPYPNIAKSSDTAKGAKKVTCDGNPVCVKDSNFMMSTGDEPGSLMGIASNKVKGKAEFVNFSFDVQVEGKNVPRAFDLMLHNDKNTPPVPVMQPPIVAVAGGSSTQECGMCGESKGTKSSGGGGGDGGVSAGAPLPMSVPSGAHGASGGGGAGGAGGGAAGAAGPTAATPSSPAAAATSSETTSRVISVDWNSSHLWCSDRAGFTGTISGDVGAATMPGNIQPVGGGNPHQAEAKVSGGGFSGNWLIKDVLPPIQCGHPAKEQPFDITVGGVKAPVPLKVRFAPSAPRRQYNQNRHHFWLVVEDQKITVGDDVKYVQGWAAEVVNLGESVPAGTGGLLDAAGFDWPGYRWMRTDRNVKKYWNGATWERLPRGFVLRDANNFCVGFYKKDGAFVCQYGGTWPESFPDWDIGAADKQTKITQWTSTINSTWTNKFDMKRADCKSGDRGCCRYPITMKTQFTKHAVFQDGLLIIADGNIRSNDQLFFIGDPDLEMAAHEVGHHIGNPDEYEGARVDTSLDDDGATDGIDRESIMGQNMTTVKKRHFRLLCRVFTDAVAAEYGRTFPFQPVPA